MLNRVLSHKVLHMGRNISLEYSLESWQFRLNRRIRNFYKKNQKIKNKSENLKKSREIQENTRNIQKIQENLKNHTKIILAVRMSWVCVMLGSGLHHLC